MVNSLVFKGEMYYPIMQKNDVIELEISSLAYGGKGVGLYIEKYVPYSIFIPLTAPGDKVKVRITDLRHRFAEAELIEVIKPSKHRITPPCQYFSDCGGCDWQHIDYSIQLEQKQRIVEEEFKKVNPKLKINKIIPSKQFSYRDRARFHKVSNSLGLKKRNSDEIVKIYECLVCSDVINQGIKEKKGLELSTSETYELPEFGLKFKFTQDIFTQPNFEQNKKLVSIAIEYLDLYQRDRVLDLYCGIGNFSLPIAKIAKKVIGIEGVEESIEIANENAEKNNITNAEFHIYDVPYWIELNKKDFDRILIDPPRTGIGKAAEKINEWGAEKIVYISCDARTLSKDLKMFTNYKIGRVQPIDMSPQTYHIETVVELTKKEFKKQVKSDNKNI